MAFSPITLVSLSLCRLRQDAIAANRDLPADCACESDDDLQAQGSAEAATSLPASDASVQEQPVMVAILKVMMCERWTC